MANRRVARRGSRAQSLDPADAARRAVVANGGPLDVPHHECAARAEDTLIPLKMAQAAAWLLDQLDAGTELPGVTTSDYYPPDAELRTYLTHMSIETLVTELASVRSEIEKQREGPDGGGR